MRLFGDSMELPLRNGKMNINGDVCSPFYKSVISFERDRVSWIYRVCRVRVNVQTMDHETFPGVSNMSFDDGETYHDVTRTGSSHQFVLTFHKIINLMLKVYNKPNLLSVLHADTIYFSRQVVQPDNVWIARSWRSAYQHRDMRYRSIWS